MNDFLHGDLTGSIIAAAMEVHNTLGPGFLESIYEQALVYELAERGISAESQQKVSIHYKGTFVGKHILDLVVDQKVIVELKTVTELADIHKAIVLSYLAATKYPVALLINFKTKRLQYKRFDYDQT